MLLLTLHRQMAHIVHIVKQKLYMYSTFPGHCSSLYFAKCSARKLIVIRRQQKLFRDVSSCQHAVQCVFVCVSGQHGRPYKSHCQYTYAEPYLAQAAQ